MTEPTGHRTDGTPWEEARPPHLPDRLTRVPLLVWPFVVLAILQVLEVWLEFRARIVSDVGVLPEFAVAVAIRAVPSLIGAALFLRHPDALRTLPLLVVSVILLAMEQVLSMMRQPLQPIFDAIWTSPTDVVDSAVAFFIATLPSTLYGLVVIAIGAAAIWFLARGLQRARHHGHDWSRALFAVLGVISVLLMANRIGLYLPALDESFGALGPVVIALDAALGLASMLVTSYLVVVAVAGWRAGERPSIGWALVAVAAALGILVPVAFTILAAVPIDGFAPALGIGMVAIAAGPLALLLAFAMGLPAAEPAAEPATDADATPDPPGATTQGSAGS